jgi:hypothetical protein
VASRQTASSPASGDWTINNGWIKAAAIATDLITWTRLLGIHVQPTVVEAAPDTLRYRILHLLARLAMHARSRVLPRRRLAMDPRRSEMLAAPLRPTSAPELTSSPDE